MSTAVQPVSDIPGDAPGDASQWIVPAFLLAATLAVYGRTVGFQFVFDDTTFILANPFVQSAANIPRFFTESVWSGIAIARQNYYRPVFLLWVLGNYALFGAHPAGWHAAALLLHCLNTAMVYLVALRLVRRPLAAGAGAALFALHPVQAEAVSWICCGNDLLACFFALAAFLTYLRAVESYGWRSFAWWGGSLASYAAAALSKEPAVGVPALILFHEWSGRAAVRARPENGAATPARRSLRVGWYFGIAAVYFLLRRNALGAWLVGPAPVTGTGTELLTIPSVLFAQLSHLVWPVNLSPFYDLSYERVLSFRGVVLPSLLLVIPAGLVGWAAVRSAAARFSVAWAALFLVPTLDIAALPRGELVHDRYLYLPMAGVGMLAAVGIAAVTRNWSEAPEATRRGRHTFAWTAGVMLAALGLVCWHQTGYWSNNFELFRRGVEIAPQNGIAAGNLGIEYMKVGDRATATELLRQAAALNPDIWEADKQQAYVHYRAGRFKEAEQVLEVLLATRPDDGFCHLLLGLTYLKTGRPTQAVEEGRRAVALSPHEAGLHYGLATILEATGDLEGARAEYKAELALRPNHQPSLEKLRELDQKLGSVPGH